MGLHSKPMCSRVSFYWDHNFKGMGVDLTGSRLWPKIDYVAGVEWDNEHLWGNRGAF